METAYIYSNNALGTNVLNFDNGTIRSLSSNAQGLIQTNIKTYVFSGGATFDTNGFDTIVPNSLLAPIGSGVTDIALGGTLTGYVGAPVVKISGGGGVGAAAVANFDPATGTITGITITSPGSGYTSAPTITLVGGNGGSTGAGAGTATATATVGAVTSGGIVKTGVGTLTLQGTNTYTGTTLINAGTLKIASTGSLASATLSVSAGATLDISANTGFTLGASQTLMGSGTVVGAMAINGTVAPGAGSAGTLSTGDFTLASTAALSFKLQSGDVTIGNNINDLISVGGNLTLDGTLDITELGGSLADGSTYRLFNYTGTLTDNTVDLSSAFLALHPGSTIDTSVSGEIDLQVVPEPGTWAMLVGGFGMLAFGRRRRRRN
jgi:fibronectin-binding autotransporter adhesin